MTESIQIRTRSETIGGDGIGRILTRRSDDQIERIPIAVVATAPPIRPAPIEAESLYEGGIGRGRLILRAKTILDSGVVRLSRAVEMLTEERGIEADYEVTLFQGDIPELFCCQSLSDGFGAVVVALYHAMKNRHGEALNRDQIEAIRRCADRLRNEVFLKYDTALDLIDDLENTGLSTDPPIAKDISAVLLYESDS